MKRVDIAVSTRSHEIADFCRRHRIAKLSFYDSVICDGFRPDSEVNVLVEFATEHMPGFFRLHDIEEELTEIMGRSTDLRTPQDLSRYLRDEIIAASQVIYEQGQS